MFWLALYFMADRQMTKVHRHVAFHKILDIVSQTVVPSPEFIVELFAQGLPERVLEEHIVRHCAVHLLKDELTD